MRTHGIIGAACAVLAGAGPLPARAIDWTNAGGDRLWHNPLNWSAEAIPAADDTVTIGAVATLANAVVLSGAAGVCSNLTLNSNGGSCLDIAADLTVGGTLLLANDLQGRIRQTAGTVTVAGPFNVAHANGGDAALTISGADSLFHVLGANTVARWRGARASLRIEDGATAVFEKALDIAGQWDAATPSTVSLAVSNGALLDAKSDLGISAGGVGRMTVADARVRVGGTWFTRANSTCTLGDGAQLSCNVAAVGHYRSSNALVVQEAGSEAVARKGLRISGYDQGGANQATNNVYEMRGGLLIVSNGMMLANNGHGVFRQSGGVAEIRTGDIQLQTQTSTGSDLVLPVSSLELSQDAVFRHLGGTFYLGGDPYNPAPGKVVIRGATPTMAVQALRFRASGVFSPLVGPDGVAPLTVAGNATFDAGCAVLPEALPGAAPGEQTILTWGGTGTTPGNLALHPDANAAEWKLMVDAAGKRVLLRRRVPASLLMIR